MEHCFSYIVTLPETMSLAQMEAFFNAIHTAVNPIVQAVEHEHNVDLDISSYILDGEDNAVY